MGVNQNEEGEGGWMSEWGGWSGYSEWDCERNVIRRIWGDCRIRSGPPKKKEAFNS